MHKYVLLPEQSDYYHCEGKLSFLTKPNRELKPEPIIAWYSALVTCATEIVKHGVKICLLSSYSAVMKML